MPANWRGLDYVEYMGDRGTGVSPVFEFGVDRSNTVRTWDIDYADRSRAPRIILGYSEIRDGTLGGQYISRITPYSDPDWTRPGDNVQYQYATGLSGQGFGINRAIPPGELRTKTVGDTARWEQARLKIRMETLPYEILSDQEMVERGHVDDDGNPDESTLKRYVSIFPRPKGKFLGLVGSTFRFTADNAPLPQPPGRIIPSWDIRIVWHQVPERAVPSIMVNPDLKASKTLGAIDTTTGKVNRFEFMGFEPGMLLCLAPEFTPRRDPRGQRIYDVQFYFEFFPLFHNRVPRVRGGIFGFVNCSADGTDYGVVTPLSGKLIYDSADFADLFRVPA